MQEKASSYVERTSPAAEHGGKERQGRESRSEKHSQNGEKDDEVLNEEGEAREKSSDSTFILLIILILLSQGETDDKLLLALLYLLF